MSSCTRHLQAPKRPLRTGSQDRPSSLPGQSQDSGQDLGEEAPGRRPGLALMAFPCLPGKRGKRSPCPVQASSLTGRPAGRHLTGKNRSGAESKERAMRYPEERSARAAQREREWPICTLHPSGRGSSASRASCFWCFTQFLMPRSAQQRPTFWYMEPTCMPAKRSLSGAA